MAPNDPSDSAVEELLTAWDLDHPDPVDTFEDELARRLGLVRHPSTSREDWRGQRVRLIEAAEPNEELVAESFFGTLKTELVHRTRWLTRLAARTP